MSELVPNVLALNKGLDLQSPKLVAPPGSVLDSLNYEQVDFQGQKRIDGYTRYDGSPLSAVNDIRLVVKAISEVPYPQGESHYVNDYSYGNYAIGFNNNKPYGLYPATVYKADNNDYLVLVVIDETNLPEGVDWKTMHDVVPADKQQKLLNDVNNDIRELVEELPGPISGLHWYKDRLYAVVDIENYTPSYPKVLDPRINKANNASLFEARNFFQVLKEDAPGPYAFGWKFVHQGWKVLFKNGISLFGKLPAINQNRQGIGIEGPTSTELNNGAAGTLLQNVSISGMAQQVNGWKDSTTATTYALNPAAIQYDDSGYVYADAYISWDAVTGTVTGDTGTLVQYSPTNQVEIT